jgi:UDP-N-acetylmuramate dehydrogenase
MSLGSDLEAAVGLPVLVEEPMSLHTTIRVGGPADLFVQVESAAQLAAAVRFAWWAGLPWLVLGSGSNVLVSDRGIRGLVIQNASRQVISAPAGDATDSGDEVRLRVESGASLSHLLRTLAAQGLGGLEWAGGIPGTLGGAIVGNAGAYGCSISKSVERVSVLSYDLGEVSLSGEDLGFAYRHSRWKWSHRGGGTEPPEIILSADLRLESLDREALQNRISQLIEERRGKHPTEPSAGCAFKNPNPPHQTAGRLIEQVGLKGQCVGDAQVSTRHANFIVNLDRAKAGEVRDLMNLVQERVRAELGIELWPEIEYVGEW